MLKVLILGSSGMAGHVMTLCLEQNSRLEVSNLSHTTKLNSKTVIMDVSNLKEFNEYLEANSFDVIINCIGVLNQFAEQRKDNAALLNGYLPHFLEHKYSQSPTKIIHISTDCVFSGKTGSYIETSFKDGDSFYDRTKAIGEIVNGNDLTFRTSIIGPDMNCGGIGLFNWFMKQNGEINGYANAIWSGITTIQLAKAVEAALFSDLTGLYHIVPEKSINKYELLKLLKEKFNKNNISIKENHEVYINKSLINTRKDFDYKVPLYDEMIHEMKQWVDTFKHLYPHYIG